jgi:cytoskeletal protein RodZ
MTSPVFSRSMGTGDVSFSMTKTIGQKLKAAREEKRLTLEKVFEDIRIRIQYLRALEADDLSIMPSSVQARGYLRNYAQYLELDFEKLLGELRAEYQPISEIIGPADGAEIPEPPAQLPASTLAGKQPENQAESVISQHAEQPLDEKMPPPLTPRPARRKKEDSQSVEPDKRRSRKKVEPAPELILGTEPVFEAVEKPVDSIEPPQQAPESVVEENSAEVPEAESQPDLGDSLWQSWLNRLSSTLSVRARRSTLVPKESAISVPALDAVSMGSDAISEGDIKQEPNETQPAPSREWAAILKEIGTELRQRRELLSLHLEEVERNTHVKAHYLAALEKGAIDDLPSTVQTRGMLSNYATFLDLDVDVLLLRFADALQAWHRERNPQKPARKSGQPIIENIPSVRSFIAGDMIFGIGIAILLVGFSIWGVSRVLTIQGQQDVQPTAPSISDVLLGSPEASEFTATAEPLPAQIPGEATVTVLIPTQNLDVNVQINLVAVERTYMRVIADGEEVFNGRVVPGAAYPYQAETQIEVLVGSGAAIRTVYNGRDLGLMGSFGQVVNNIYLAEEIITPTVMPSPTITSTVASSATTSPTATPSSTSTPVPSVTSLP